MVITQSKLIVNYKTMKILKDRRASLIDLIFWIASKHNLKVLEKKKLCPAYLIACATNKQAVKVLKD